MSEWEPLTIDLSARQSEILSYLVSELAGDGRLRHLPERPVADDEVTELAQLLELR